MKKQIDINSNSLIVIHIKNIILDDNYCIIAKKIDSEKNSYLDVLSGKRFNIKNDFLETDSKKITNLKVIGTNTLYDYLLSAYKKNHFVLLFLDLDNNIYHIEIPGFSYPQYYIKITKQERENGNKDIELYRLETNYNNENKIFNGFKKMEQDLIKKYGKI